jgi:hypothetical protein
MNENYITNVLDRPNNAVGGNLATPKGCGPCSATEPHGWSGHQLVFFFFFSLFSANIDQF